MRPCSTSSCARRSSPASGISAEQRDRIVIELPPAHRIQIAEQAGGIVVPAPPQIARQRPQPLLRGSDEAIQRARLAHHRRDLRGRLGQHLDFVVRESARLDRLHHQNALQNSAIDQRHAEKGLVGLFARFAEILEARMILDLLDGHRLHLFGHQAREPFVQRHPQRADALRAQSDRRGQHQIGAVRLQQVGGANIGLEALGDQRDHVHQRLRRLAALRRKIADFLQRQNIAGVPRIGGWHCGRKFLFVPLRSRTRLRHQGPLNSHKLFSSQIFSVHCHSRLMESPIDNIYPRYSKCLESRELRLADSDPGQIPAKECNNRLAAGLAAQASLSWSTNSMR